MAPVLVAGPAAAAGDVAGLHQLLVRDVQQRLTPNHTQE